MKKFLSLVLALVMTMSLVTVSAGAVDFTDDSDIDYKEAVDVISALGIVDGYSDDSFRPDGSLTRGAAAKIICNLILGPTTASALSATTAPFKDVPTTNTFAGYITYCSQQGIISGYGDGTFRPSGTLTGNAFMKMLLGALGYDSSIEGYSGANWQVNVIKQAVGIGLDDGNDEFVGSQAVTRQEAALYSFNMLKSTMVEYDQTSTIVVGDITINTASTRDEVANSNRDDNTIKQDGKMQFAEKYFPRLTRTAADTDAFGRPANEWKYRSEVIGKYADDTNLIATYEGTKVEKGELYSLVGSSVVNGIDDGKSTLTVWVDGEEVSSPAVADYFVRNSTGAAGTKNAVNRGDNVGITGNGVLTEVYMDDDNNVTVVLVNTYLVKATADYNTTRESLSIEVLDEINTNSDANAITVPAMGTTIDNDDVYVANFKEDDYILVTWSDMEDAIQSAELAEVVTGEVSEYTETKNVFLDGTKYEYNKLVGTNESSVHYTIGEDAKVVLDAYGYIIYVDAAVATNSYVFLADMTSTSASLTVRYNAYFTDGTYDEIVVKRVNGSSSTGSLQGAGNSWYTFSKDENGRYSLNDVNAPLTTADVNGFKGFDTTGNNNASAVTVTQNGIVQFASVLTGVKGDSSTIFVVVEADNDVTAYTGVANVPDITIPEQNSTLGIASGQYADLYAVYNQNNGYADYVLIDLTNAADAKVDDANSVADFLFILKTTGNKTYVADDEYWQYEVVMDNEKTTKYIAESIGASNGDLMRNVKENSKGYITDADFFNNADRRDVITMGGTDTVNYSNGTLTVTGTNPDGGSSTSYVLKDDCKATLMVGGAADELLKDKDADYELYQTSVRSAAGILKNYGLAGKVYVAVDSDNGHVATDVYFYVSDAKEIAAPNDEAELLGITVKGVEAKESHTTGVDYEVELPYGVAADTTHGLVNLVADVSDGASYTVKFGTTLGSYTPWADAGTADQNISSWNDPSYFEITVTAQDTSTSNTYVLMVTQEDALALTTGVGITAVSNPTVTAPTSGTITVNAGNAGDLLVALKAQLGTDATNVVITSTNSYGAAAEVAADTAVADSMVVEATSVISGIVYKWTISVNP